jgi:hypothetical protein
MHFCVHWNCDLLHIDHLHIFREKLNVLVYIQYIYLISYCFLNDTLSTWIHLNFVHHLTFKIKIETLQTVDKVQRLK